MAEPNKMLEETANYLLNHCFVLGGVEDQRAKYLYVQDHLPEVRAVFAPLGFADWRCATSLISGFIAKESVVSTLQILLGGAALSTMFTGRSVISFLVFTLLYTPCIAAVTTIRREFGSALKTVGVVMMQCCVAWIVALAVYTLVGIL